MELRHASQAQDGLTPEGRSRPWIRNAASTGRPLPGAQAAARRRAHPEERPRRI